jgi:tetratricopeptide (TPR) repeat protein
MGVVYEAFDRERGQAVAVKTLLHFDAAALYRFKQEFRTLSDVQHPNLVQLYELVSPPNGEVFFAMELVRGTDLLEYVRGPREAGTGSQPASTTVVAVRRRPVVEGAPAGAEGPHTAEPGGTRADLSRVRTAFRQLVEGVEALHAAGKLHRDIKPSNVLVSAEGRVVLLDFGVSTEVARRVGESGGSDDDEVVGTARYMAPEQAFGDPPTPAADWYSVGVMLYEALVGEPPFTGPPTYVLTQKANVDAPPPSLRVRDVPPELDALCVALLSRDAGARPAGPAILGSLGLARTSLPPPMSARVPVAAASLVGRESALDELQQAFDAIDGGGAAMVRVTGPSGMGKSVLVHRYLDALALRRAATVLRGRVFERETLPYKAVDSVVDALTRHLVAAAEEGTAPAAPAGAWALVRLFPVLDRVPGLAGNGPTSSALDPRSVQRTAFAALRELIAALGAASPVVMFIDEAHHGDVDSAALLAELLRQPAAPRLLVIVTARTPADGPFLAALEERWPDGVTVRDVRVAALTVDESRRLALTLLDPADPFAPRVARAVAREAGGSPFLVEELVRANRGQAESASATLGAITLEHLVGERLRRLPEAARRLAEIVAVAGKPLPLGVFAEASRLEADTGEIAALTSAKRLTARGLRDGVEVVDFPQERIRQTVIATLSPERLRECHAGLAHALANATPADPEAVADHWLGAGEPARAVAFAVQAADRATAKLAFNQAATLYELALAHCPPEARDRGALQVRVAEAQRVVGRHADAARTYLDAIETAPADRRSDLRRLAAENLLAAGRIDDGAAVLREVLDHLGLRIPRSVLAIVVRLIVYRVWMLAIGLKFGGRPASQVRPEDRRRIDALHAVAVGFSLVDSFMAVSTMTRHLIEAFRKGDRTQVLRAAALESAHTASLGLRESPRERALAQLARELAAQDGSAEARSLVEVPLGIALFMRGRWRETIELLDGVAARLPYAFTGSSNTRVYAGYARYLMGRLAEGRRHMESVLADADDRGDIYISVNVRINTAVMDRLAADDRDGAYALQAKAMATWSQRGYFVQHWSAMIYAVQADLYGGDVARARARLDEARRPLRRSMLLRVGHLRGLTYMARARVAAAAAETEGADRDACVAEAHAMGRRLEKEYDPWARALGSLARALGHSAAGHPERAVAAFREGVARAEATETMLFGVPARYCLGRLVGGEEGAALVCDATATLEAEGVRKPELWVRSLLPGRW